jgi:hypothetical protein
MPRWLKVLGIAIALLAFLMVVLLLVNGGGGDGGGHGPRRHALTAGGTP